MRFIYVMVLCVFVGLYSPVSGQSAHQNKKERKHIRKKWKKSNQSYNPYLDKRAKNKPSAKMARADKKEIKKQKRLAKRQMRHSKRRIGRNQN